MQLESRAMRSTALPNEFMATKEIQPEAREVSNEEVEGLEEEDAEMRGTKSTAADAAGMRRMGKDQQLLRHFRVMSITSFAAVATASWEIGLFILTPALVDGGVSGMCWSVMWNFIAYCPIYLSLAEMASMAPIAGAQYHWVSGL